MPPVAIAIALGAAGAVVGGLTAAAIIGGVLTAALGIASYLLAPKPKSPSFDSFEQRAAGQAVSSRTPIGYWRVVYGEARVSGPPLYMGTSDNNNLFHVVTAVAAHEIDSFQEFQIGDRWVNPDDLDANGQTLTTSPLAQSGVSMLRIKTKLGTASQTAFEDLVAESANGEWTVDHRARGHSLLYCRYYFQTSIYPGGLPNQAAVIRGKKVYDPRDGQTRWTPNAALCIRDYCLTAKNRGGYGMSSVDETVFQAAANVCDEFVDSPTTGDAALSHAAGTVDATTDAIEVDGEHLKFQTGDRVTVASTGTVPGGLSAGTSYYVIPKRRRAWKRSPTEVYEYPSVQLATSYANALAGSAINLTDAGTGSITLTKTGEPRYTINGTYTLDQSPRKLMEELLTACGGRVPEGAGAMRLMGLAWAAPTLTLDEDDLRGPLKVQTKRARRDRFNAVRGTFVSPMNDYQPSDYPAVTSATYLAADLGERIYGDYDQPFTSRAGQAQRVAKIELVRNRFERTVSFPAMLSAYDCKAGEIIAIDNDRWSWSDKTFEVVEWKPALADSDDGAPYLGTDLVLNETDSSIFTWASTEEQAHGPVIGPTLPDYSNLPAPGTPAISEYLFEGRDGSDVKAVARMEWAASATALVSGYETEFWPSSGTEADAVAFSVPTGADVLLADRFDVEPGRYVFRVRGLTNIGAKTAWATSAAIEIYGLNAAPAAIAGLGLQKLGGQALLRWDLHADADVIRGGWIEFRHSPEQVGASASASTTIGDRVDGRSTVAALPLKAGTYFARAVDKIGNLGPWASVSTDGALQLSYSTVGSIVEDTAFAGTHSSTIASASTLKLNGTTAVDSWGAVDSVADWDSEGGIVAAGTYTFSAGIDLGSVQRGRLRGHIKAAIVNVLDMIDSRAGNVDDWDDWDGTAPGAADAWIEFRQTADDPAASPTWTSWARLDVNEVNARAFQFRAQLVSRDTAYNIAVSELRAYAEDPAL